MPDKKIIDFRLPSYLTTEADWAKYRLTFAGGTAYREAYLEQFTSRESQTQFRTRRDITPIPTFAKEAIKDTRNAIYQPMIDIVRRDGSDAYHRAIMGRDMGVNRRGASMNAFMGQEILEELLVIGKVGIYVDAPEIQASPTIAQVGDFRPFVYPYKIEDILSYACSDPENPSEFKSLLLRDTVIEYDSSSGLPTEETIRYRHLWIGDDGHVWIQFYDEDDTPTDRDGKPSGPFQMQLNRIPFTLLDIGPSLLVDVCEYQIALLNLVSSDVNYALLANFPFYTEQVDKRAVGGHLKQTANPDGTATQGGQGAHDKEIKVGVTQGRRYVEGTERPGFIHPSSEPLKASMALQEKMEGDIRRLVSLAVSTLASRASADSKAMDNRGLEAGLSYIGLKLEAAERQITEFWAAYESADKKNRRVATIKYPDRYSLKSDEDRIEEAGKLSKVIMGTPSKTARKELWKVTIMTLLGGKVSPDVVSKITKEIDAAGFTTADPEVIIQAKDAGLVGEQLASIALGFPENEYLQARKDHATRIKLIAEHQGVDKAPMGAASRGVVDLDDNPANSGPAEKTESRDTLLQDTTKDRTRGKGKN